MEPGDAVPHLGGQVIALLAGVERRLGVGRDDVDGCRVSVAVQARLVGALLVACGAVVAPVDVAVRVDASDEHRVGLDARSERPGVVVDDERLVGVLGVSVDRLVADDDLLRVHGDHGVVAVARVERDRGRDVGVRDGVVLCQHGAVQREALEVLGSLCDSPPGVQVDLLVPRGLLGTERRYGVEAGGDDRRGRRGTGVDCDRSRQQCQAERDDCQSAKSAVQGSSSGMSTFG